MIALLADFWIGYLEVRPPNNRTSGILASIELEFLRIPPPSPLTPFLATQPCKSKHKAIISACTVEF